MNALMLKACLATPAESPLGIDVDVYHPKIRLPRDMHRRYLGAAGRVMTGKPAPPMPLTLSLNFPGMNPTFTETALNVTLHFSGESFRCRLPYEAITLQPGMQWRASPVLILNQPEVMPGPTPRNVLRLVG